MTKITDEDVLVRFTRVGKVELYDPTHGLHEVAGELHCDGERFKFHISQLLGTRVTTAAALKDEWCAFNIGGSARRFADEKPDWLGRVAEFYPLVGTDIPTNRLEFSRLRTSALSKAGAGALKWALQATVYSQDWARHTGKSPEVCLVSDEALVNEVHTRLANASGFDELTRILNVICNSPWFTSGRVPRESAFEKFFRPDGWDSSALQPTLRPSEYKGFFALPETSQHALLRTALESNSVAIDLEIRGTQIKEFGWATRTENRAEVSPTGVDTRTLSEALKQAFGDRDAPCIVGHNILKFDLPALAARGVVPPPLSGTWDTLLADWLLEPWKRSHALIVKDAAHTAIADAKECFGLFKRQLNQLQPVLKNTATNLDAVADELLGNPSLLGRVAGRAYPNDLTKQSWTTAVYPASQRTAFRWQVGCAIELLSTVDPVLDPEVCRHVASNSAGEPFEAIAAKLVAIIAADAQSNGVSVRLSWLPLWLIEPGQLGERLKTAHLDLPVPQTASSRQTILIAEDLFALDDDAIAEVISTRAPYFAHSEQVDLIWQKARSSALTGERLPRTSSKVSPSRKALYRHADYPVAWLLYSPLPRKKTNGISWSVLPERPSWWGRSSRDPDGRVRVAPQGEVSADSKRLLADYVKLPRWTDADDARLRLERTFVGPDTANRPAYLRDVATCLLNLLNTLKDEETLLVAMKWREEAEELANHLANLSLTTKNDGTVKNWLERCRARGHRILTCAIDQVPDFIAAADSIDATIRIAVMELPLQEWHALLHTPSDDDNEGADVSKTSKDDEDDVSGESEDDLTFSDSVTPQMLPRTKPSSGAGDSRLATERQPLTPKEVRSVVDRFVSPWLVNLGLRIDGHHWIILDARLASGAGATNSLKPHIIPFREPAALLEGDDLTRFQADWPARLAVSESAGLSFEDYKQYAKSVFDPERFEDFRPNQVAPFQCIANSSKDLLVRLPTGGGKSHIFQIPALANAQKTGRLTIVITPLRALMQDQVKHLHERGYLQNVDFLSGGRDAWLNQDVYEGIVDGRIHLVFAAPERFRVPRFIDAVKRRREMDGRLEFIVFDEAHCVSEWGFEFRPEYLNAARTVREQFRAGEASEARERLILVSATITERNRTDLENELGLGTGDAYDCLPSTLGPPIQDFIHLEAYQKSEAENVTSGEKFEQICRLLERTNLGPGSAALLFARRRADCEDLSTALNNRAEETRQGGLGAVPSLATLVALPFHAGLPEATKAEAVERLKASDATASLPHGDAANLLVCTNAFGMGMDIPHLQACIHHRPPTFVEDYLQEVGRIGRDEKKRKGPIVASLLYDQRDFDRNLRQIQENKLTPTELADFFGYCLEQGVHFPALNTFVALVPSELKIGTKDFDEGRINGCLFWLQRMKVLKVEGSHPPMVRLNLNTLSLRKLVSTTDRSELSRAATVILELAGSSEDLSQQARSPVGHVGNDAVGEAEFRRLLRSLSRGLVGLSGRRGVQHNGDADLSSGAPTSDAASTQRTVDLPGGELMTRLELVSQEDLERVLFSLQQAGHVERIRDLHITAVQPHAAGVTDLIEEACNLLQGMAGALSVFPRTELRDALAKALADRDQSEVTLLRHQSAARRALRTALTMMRRHGAEVREVFDVSGNLGYLVGLSPELVGSVRAKIRNDLTDITKLRDFLSTRVPSGLTQAKEPTPIAAFDLLQVLGQSGSWRQLQHVVRLLSHSGLYRFDAVSETWGSVVTIRRTMPLPSWVTSGALQHDDDSEAAEVQRCYAEIANRTKMQELRANAMILLALLPAIAQRDFIQGYFDAGTHNDLAELLEQTIADHSDQLKNDESAAAKRLKLSLEEILSAIRKENFEMEFNLLSDEQRAVCEAPHGERLLVNAGPGAGKTKVLTLRTAHLIHAQQLRPDEILVLAFNRSVVSEIRERIRKLFRTIGYGSYVDRLNVQTFHSFALSEMEATAGLDEDILSDTVHRLANAVTPGALGFDAARAGAIGRRYRAILVDEFQDMNEDFYRLIEALIRSSGGGAMVIGDDDQDILRWNRRTWAEKHPEMQAPMEATAYFKQFQNAFEPTLHALTTNYRSAANIVEVSNNLIVFASEQIGFERMKKTEPLVAHRQESGLVSDLNPEDPAGHCVQLVASAYRRRQSVAVLCRSNREARTMHARLRTDCADIPRSAIQLLGSKDRRLQQLRVPGALLDLLSAQDPPAALLSTRLDEFLDSLKQRQFRDFDEECIRLQRVRALAAAENERVTHGSFVEFLREIRSTDLIRLGERHDVGPRDGRIVVSTIHKVKGLEYDTVIVFGSEERFPMNVSDDANDLISEAAAEEARLAYVAYTRAKLHLVRIKDDRLKKGWLRKAVFDRGGELATPRLKGDPSEVDMTKSGTTYNFPRQHDYIEQKISVGDELTLSRVTGTGKAAGSTFFEIAHQGRTVGSLSRQTGETIGNQLIGGSFRVSEVVRCENKQPPFTADIPFANRDFLQNRWNDLHPDARKNGWCYAVLIESA